VLPAVPVWLQDEPEMAALLSAVLDRFDQQAGESRQRAILLPAEKHLSSLARGDAHADDLWSYVQTLAQQGLLSIRLARRDPYDPQWRGAKLAFAPDGEPTLRAWLARPASPSQMSLWREAVHRHRDCFPAAQEMLLARRVVVPGRTADELVAALARLGQVDGPATLRQLSALAFWGDSKVLDDRGDLIAALFPQLCIRERLIVVAVHLPPQIESVLFIENLDTYSAAIDGQPPQTAGHALVYMAGFRGAAARIRSPQGARLHFAGPGRMQAAAFDRWWFEEGPASPSPGLPAGLSSGPSGGPSPGSPPESLSGSSSGVPGGSLRRAYFWGDLDFAGMQILKSLRQRFREVEAWQPGYQVMLADRLAAPPGDTRGRRDLSRQIDPGTTGCEYADSVLLPAIRTHGFWDQERIADRTSGISSPDMNTGEVESWVWKHGHGV